MAGGSANTNIEWTSSDAAVVRSMDKIANQMDRMGRKMDAIEAKGAKGSKATVTGMQAATQSVGQFVKGFAGIGAVMAGVAATIEILRKEWEHLQQQQKDAKAAGIKVAPAVAQATKALGGIRTGDANQRNLEEASLRTGIPITMLAEARIQGYAAAQVETEEQAALVDQAVEDLYASDPTLSSKEGAAVIPATYTMNRAFGLSTKEGIGAFDLLGGMTRIADPEAQSKYLMSTLGTLGNKDTFGEGLDTSAAFVSVINEALDDREGSRTSTLTKNLAEALRKRGMTLQEGMNMSPEELNKFFRGGDWGPGIGKLPGATFGAEQAAAEAVLKQGDEFRRRQENVQTMDFEAAYRKQVRENAGSNLGRMFAKDLRNQADNERRDLSRKEQATTQIGIEGADAALVDAGVSSAQMNLAFPLGDFLTYMTASEEEARAMNLSARRDVAQRRLKNKFGVELDEWGDPIDSATGQPFDPARLSEESAGQAQALIDASRAVSTALQELRGFSPPPRQVQPAAANNRPGDGVGN